MNYNFTFYINDKALALPVLLLCELIRNCKILRITDFRYTKLIYLPTVKKRILRDPRS